MSAVDLAAIGAWLKCLGDYQLVGEAPSETLGGEIERAALGGLDQPFEPILTVLLLGATGVGKSQLINALAGSPIAEAGHRRPTTRYPLVYAHQSIDLGRLYEYGLSLGAFAGDEDAIRRHGEPALRRLILIDGPDIDSVARDHRERVLALLPAVDVVLYVVTAEKYKDDVGWQLVLRERGARAFAFIFNKWDPLGKQAAPPGALDVDDDFRSLLEEAGYHDPLLFRTSAEYWVRRATGEAGSAPPPGDEFPALDRWLRSGLASDDVRAIQERRRRAALGELAAAVVDCQPPALAGSHWVAQTEAALDTLERHGTRRIELGARAAAASIAPDDNPIRSPGLLGQSLRFVAWLAALGNRVAAPPRRPVNDAAGSLAGDLADEAASYLDQLDDQRLAGWCAERWRSRLLSLRQQVDEAATTALVEAIDRPPSAMRRAVGSLALGAVELAILAVAGLAVWRLAEGLVTAQYVGLPFVVNVAGLAILLLLIGGSFQVLCFPSREPLVRRAIEQAVGDLWRTTVRAGREDLRSLVAANESLRAKGETITLAIQQAIEEQRRTEPDPVRRLFASRT
ncbi:MAG: GTPase [Dehalococcoidia bacterium]